MRVSTIKALFLRDLIVPLLCAMMALSSVASARAVGGKALQTSGSAHFELCLPSGSGEGDTTSHDCDACCLPMSIGLGRLPQPAFSQAAVLENLRITSSVLEAARPSPNLPWSRGPPAFG